MTEPPAPLQDTDLDSSNDATRKPRGIDWKDPSVPAGNAPAMPRWPLLLAAAAWIGWSVFLVVIRLTRQDVFTV